MKNLKKELQKYNLSENEATLYLSLLELGETSIQRISKKSKISRTTTYTVIESLQKKGLIITTKKQKRTFYYAENPKKLKNILEEKLSSLEKLIPSLLEMSNLIDRKPKIKFFEGEEGIKNIYKDTLNFPDSEMLAWTSPEAFKYIDMDFLFKEYVPLRAKNKIWAKVIIPQVKIMEEYTKDDRKSLRETRFIKTEKGKILEIEIMLYGKNKVSFQSFKESFGLIIESQAIFNTLKIIFMSQWESIEENKKKRPI